MKRMSESKPIFLRCIKPNSSKSPNDFEEKFVLLQVNSQYRQNFSELVNFKIDIYFKLRYCGVLETTRIRKEGYALRPTFEEFIDRLEYRTNLFQFKI